MEMAAILTSASGCNATESVAALGPGARSSNPLSPIIVFKYINNLSGFSVTLL